MLKQIATLALAVTASNAVTLETTDKKPDLPFLKPKQIQGLFDALDENKDGVINILDKPKTTEFANRFIDMY